MSLTDRQFIRYSRHLLMDDIGQQGQEKLLNAHVLIVGLGGLGCPVSLYLTAAGIGHISICDGDTVDVSNLQRQVLYQTEDCGHLKVDCAKAVLSGLNPELDITTYPEMISTQTLSQDYSIVIDCTDNLAARHMLNEYCQRQGIGFVTGSAIGWEGQLIGFDFARHSKLCLNCIIDRDSAEPVTNCANAGVVGPVLGTIGSLQATMAMRMLLGFFDSHGEVLRYDGKAARWLNLRSLAKSQCAVCSGQKL
ncbi:MAG: HesA/MoeB/ThiF family protein [Porticoccaceae bacterium]|nr:HesA/MoeB/ThiF family protein [Porticoccaceae bacterium]MDG1307037.1 HesA/MoeB/ThiF family protein [Porticoccaceae bacterium]